MAKRVLRQFASLVLPLTVLVVVPLWIQRDMRRSGDLAFAVGLHVMLVGLLIMAQTIVTLGRIGKGTLAPWSPTSKLVTGGMYAYVRNPMILGVIIALLGEALVFGSWRILAWAVAVFAINTVYFALSEEPGLEQRFGQEYREYKEHVPRWIPRLRPYRGNHDRSG